MFKEELKDLTQRTPTARGAIIVGIDGIPIEKYMVGDGVNLEAFSAEYLSIVKKTRETNLELGIGRIREMNIFTDDLIAIIQSVTPEYFLVFALPADGSYGRARYELRKSALRLAKELS